jgi:hypothetical protein
MTFWLMIINIDFFNEDITPWIHIGVNIIIQLGSQYVYHLSIAQDRNRTNKSIV